MQQRIFDKTKVDDERQKLNAQFHFKSLFVCVELQNTLNQVAVQIRSRTIEAMNEGSSDFSADIDGIGASGFGVRDVFYTCALDALDDLMVRETEQPISASFNHFFDQFVFQLNHFNQEKSLLALEFVPHQEAELFLKLCFVEIT